MTEYGETRTLQTPGPDPVTVTLYGTRIITGPRKPGVFTEVDPPPGRGLVVVRRPGGTPPESDEEPR